MDGGLNSSYYAAVGAADRKLPMNAAKDRASTHRSGKGEWRRERPREEDIERRERQLLLRMTEDRLHGADDMKKINGAGSMTPYNISETPYNISWGRSLQV